MTDNRPWPSLDDYLTALWRPTQSLAGRLGKFVPVRDADDTVQPVPGQSAYVFYGEIEGEPTVLRCFRRPPAPSLRKRYQRLSRYAKDGGCPAFASFRWWDDGLSAGGQQVPVLSMEDLGGRSLRLHLDEIRTDQERLESLASGWQALTAELSARRLAHGDLQQDNIWIDRDDRLRLVDLDGVWAPPLSDLPPDEYGHENFQHPQRVSSDCWGEDVDRFSALVVLVCIRALIHDPALWDEYHADENLLFRADDLARSMATPLWFRLASNRDAQVRDLTAELHQLCQAAFATVSPKSVRTVPTVRTVPAARPQAAPPAPPAPPATAAAAPRRRRRSVLAFAVLAALIGLVVLLLVATA
ncbi:hypothetical protein [Phytohabitans rumicis]|uniref:Uncharacterized protein n=1 Tax=Phytohabitans rumicis TaxID=1076125 RepID=A0A6V8L0X2_9ACTN|nr:hypothetical protein [Phytohabitans rumicis]GFJ88451.1 hypothetical protein Prum_020930 [Phytohabitans rumicis]